MFIYEVFFECLTMKRKNKYEKNPDVNPFTYMKKWYAVGNEVTFIIISLNVTG